MLRVCLSLINKELLNEKPLFYIVLSLLESNNNFETVPDADNSKSTFPVLLIEKPLNKTAPRVY